MNVDPRFPSTSLYYTTRNTGNVNTSGNPADALAAVRDTLDLSTPVRAGLDAIRNLRPDEQRQYLEILARLLREGIIGTETLEVNGQPYESFASTRFADPRLAQARAYPHR